METFKTVKENATAEIIEKKSKFIAQIFHVETIEEAEKLISETKKKYYDAKHNCYAYAIETSDGGIAVKYNDDGEPQGTAGSPILKVLLGLNISNVLVIVTRYFGGVLLGTGGLVKAYTEATKKVLELVLIINQIKGYEAIITVEYGELDKTKYYLEKNNIKINNINYSENIELIIEISTEQWEKITNINDKKTFKIIKNDIIKEKFIDI